MRTLLVLLLLSVPARARAQSVARFAPGPSPLFLAAQPEASVLTPPQYEETHWKAGAIAGGIMGGLAGAALGGALCGMNENNSGCGASTFGGLLVGAVLGGTVGALIGGQFPK